MSRAVRDRETDDFRRNVPVHAVWEITLACDLKCRHCGSRAGARRDRELDTAECLEVVAALARLGTRELSLIGGEAYLRGDWIEIIRAARAAGMRCAVQTGGRNLTEARLAAAVGAGLQAVGVSIDGLAPLHDELRGVPGSFSRAIDAVRRARAHGIAASVNTQIGARTMDDLPALLDAIVAAGATHWQIQLTVAMGNAVDNDAVLLQPYQLLELMPLLDRLYREGLDRGLLMVVGNNIGYFGPFEHRLRGVGDESVHWTGCAAGQNVIGLEADGTVKGCPSLRTSGYAGGNVRDLRLEDIWNHAEEIHFGRLATVDALWGFCRTCYYADVCRGGCTWTADSLFGRPGNNPYCHHRALELDRRGLRERVVKKREAPGAPFAIGEFELIIEPVPGREGASPAPPVTAATGGLVQLRRRRDGAVAPRDGRVPPQLAPCRACDRYIYPHEATCPHCGGDVARAAAAHAEVVQRRRALIERLERALSGAAAAEVRW
ncbi:GDL motif peptide-associated radical SAM/SPASM maturase [Sorangium sp. So ce341]|uniref:GDL motif peptide-associated radical SAM/SPASM maturase n=1 Tax=Sorangium sp. So ce341 TaxID=3133302 RepID=UPI003F6302F0